MLSLLVFINILHFSISSNIFILSRGVHDICRCVPMCVQMPISEYVYVKARSGHPYLSLSLSTLFWRQVLSLNLWLSNCIDWLSTMQTLSSTPWSWHYRFMVPHLAFCVATEDLHSYPCICIASRLNTKLSFQNPAITF